MLHFLASSFALDKAQGKDFWNSIHPPFKSLWLHQAFMDGDPPSLSSVINQSYGHPAKVKSHKMFQVTCLEVDDKKADRMKLQVQLFDELNDIRLSLSDRLANFQRLEHGFALVVRKGEEVAVPGQSPRVTTGFPNVPTTFPSVTPFQASPTLDW